MGTQSDEIFEGIMSQAISPVQGFISLERKSRRVDGVLEHGQLTFVNA